MTTAMIEEPCKKYDLPPDLLYVLNSFVAEVSSLHQPSYLQGLWGAQIFTQGEGEFLSYGQGKCANEAVVNALRPMLGKEQEELFWTLRSMFEVEQTLLDKMKKLEWEIDNLCEAIRGSH